MKTLGFRDFTIILKIISEHLKKIQVKILNKLSQKMSCDRKGS